MTNIDILMTLNRALRITGRHFVLSPVGFDRGDGKRSGVMKMFWIRASYSCCM